MRIVRVDVDLDGPIFSATRAHAITEGACEEIQEDVADEAYGMVKSEFHRTFRNPTGYYESRVHIEKEPGAHVITDGGVVYGPWLEGIGSRNAPVTRFKGYANFRRTARKVETKAHAIAQRIVTVHSRRL